MRRWRHVRFLLAVLALLTAQHGTLAVSIQILMAAGKQIVQIQTSRPFPRGWPIVVYVDVQNVHMAQRQWPENATQLHISIPCEVTERAELVNLHFDVDVIQEIGYKPGSPIEAKSTVLEATTISLDAACVPLALIKHQQEVKESEAATQPPESDSVPLMVEGPLLNTLANLDIDQILRQVEVSEDERILTILASMAKRLEEGATKRLQVVTEPDEEPDESAHAVLGFTSAMTFLPSPITPGTSPPAKCIISGYADGIDPTRSRLDVDVGERVYQFPRVGGEFDVRVPVAPDRNTTIVASLWLIPDTMDEDQAVELETTIQNVVCPALRRRERCVEQVSELRVGLLPSIEDPIEMLNMSLATLSNRPALQLTNTNEDKTADLVVVHVSHQPLSSILDQYDTAARLVWSMEPYSLTHWPVDVVVDVKRTPALHPEGARFVFVPLYIQMLVMREHIRTRYTPTDLIKSASLDLESLYKSKTKFCAFMYSHEVALRDNFFDVLSDRKAVDALGVAKSRESLPMSAYDRWMGTYDWFDRAVEKYRPYKFVIAFESEKHAGYVTEKILAAMFAGAVPIYYGAPDIAEHFNVGSFVHVRNKGDFDQAVAEILAIDASFEKWREIMSEPWLPGNVETKWFDLTGPAHELAKALNCVEYPYKVDYVPPKIAARFAQ